MQSMDYHKSEYQRRFKHDPSLNQSYKELLSLRQKRKDFNHHHTPITWDSDEDSEKENSLKNCNNDASTKKIDTAEENKHDKVITRSMSSSYTVHQSPQKEISTQTNIITTKNVAVQSPNKRTKKLENIVVRSPPPKLNLRSNKRKSEVLKKSTPKTKKTKAFIVQKAPIIAYGWADNTSIQKKRTFNVRAPSAQVRSTALQAEKLREMNKKAKSTKKERLLAEKLKKEALIDSLTNFDEWQTEYQKQFCK